MMATTTRLSALSTDRPRARVHLVAALSCTPGLIAQLAVIYLTRNLALLLWMLLIDACVYVAFRWLSRRWIGWAFAPALIYLWMGVTPLLYLPLYTTITLVK